MRRVVSCLHHGDGHSGGAHMFQREFRKSLADAAVLVLRIDGEDVDFAQVVLGMKAHANPSEDQVFPRRNPDPVAFRVEEGLDVGALPYHPAPGIEGVKDVTRHRRPEAREKRVPGHGVTGPRPATWRTGDRAGSRTSSTAPSAPECAVPDSGSYGNQGFRVWDGRQWMAPLLASLRFSPHTCAFHPMEVAFGRLGHHIREAPVWMARAGQRAMVALKSAVGSGGVPAAGFGCGQLLSRACFGPRRSAPQAPAIRGQLGPG